MQSNNNNNNFSYLSKIYSLQNYSQIETTALQGCIEKVEILQQIFPEEVWKELDWTKGISNDLAFLNWQGCPVNLEIGIHFMGKGEFCVGKNLI